MLQVPAGGLCWRGQCHPLHVRHPGLQVTITHHLGLIGLSSCHRESLVMDLNMSVHPDGSKVTSLAVHLQCTLTLKLYSV